jgi:hypothetical protein
MGFPLYAVNALNDVRKFIGQAPDPNAEDLPAHPTPTEKLTLRRDLAGDMTACMPTVERIAREKGEVWQISPTTIPSAHRFLNFIANALPDVAETYEPMPPTRDTKHTFDL